MAKTYGMYFNTLSYLSPSCAARKAFRTFCKVRKGRVLPGQAPFLQSARYHREVISGCEVQTYRWEGPGETVLLVHGWESNSFRWHRLISHLQRDGFNIIAFDAPGHGFSGGSFLHLPLYSECLQYLIDKYRPANLVAHSVGGLTAIYTLHRHPGSTVKKLVTIGTPSEFHEIMGHFRQLLHLNNRVMGALDVYVKGRFGFNVCEFSGSRFASTLHQKGMLFHDRFDTLAPYHASQQVNSKWKNSVLVTTEGLGHSMHQEPINIQITDFLFSGK
jgi:pimeloyl-ACP methyl ester carboxylesterase